MNRFFGMLALIILLSSLGGCNLVLTPTPLPSEDEGDACSLALTQTPLPAPVTQTCTGPAITLGEIADKPNQVISSMTPLANYLAKRLGFECGKVRVVETVPEMMELIKNGEVDIYMDSMYPATLVSEATGAQPILRRWRNVSEYHSVIFTRKDSGITLEDLPGHMVAMERSYSTSGFALPAAYLVDRGLKLVVKESFTDTVAADEVGIYFSGDDKNTLFLILQGKVLIGATDDFFFENSIDDALNWQPPVTLVNLAETESVIRQAVLVRPDLRSDLQEAIKKELTNAHRDPQGRTALKMAANTCKFDDPPGVIEAAFEQMQAMHDKVEEIPGWQEAFEKGN